MRWCSSLVSTLAFAAVPALADTPWMIGGGIESDSEENAALTAVVDIGVGEKTWVSAALAYSDIDLPLREEVDNLFLDVGFDHHFDPLGVRAGLAYWGDPDALESVDARVSPYWRGESGRLSLDSEFRNFDFTIPPGGLFPGRTVSFDATGLGASLGFDLGEAVDLRLAGMRYDYSVDLRLDDNRRLIDLLTVTRFSLFASLVDWRATAGIGIDAGLNRWQLDISSWEGAVDGGRTDSLTLRYLTPLTDRTDIEFGVGYDDSEFFGDAAFFSIFLYFYGG